MDTDTAPQLFHALRDSGFYTPEQIAAAEQAFAANKDDAQLADRLQSAGLLTPYQARKVRAGQSATLLFGPYLILDKIGEGGMGKVYRAVQSPTGRVVALKVVRPHLVSNRTVQRRYQREAKAAAALDHPNIVKLFDADEVGGRYYLAMEYVDGVDLARMVKQFGRPPVSGLPQHEEACEYVRQAALGLQHAHDRGLVHRDIKPSNILVCGDRALPGTTGQARVKILDMGLVRTIMDVDADEAPQTELTRDGTVVGTPEYMSPEQAKDSRTVDNRADLYSLGCTLFYLLKGHAPFPDGTPIDKLLRHQLDPPPDLRRHRPDVPNEVIEIVEKLLRKDPADRYKNAGAVALALAPYTPGGAELAAFEAAAPPVHEPFSFTSDPNAIARDPVRPAPPPPDSIPYATVVAVAPGTVPVAAGGTIPDAEVVSPPPRRSRTVPQPNRPASPVPRASTAAPPPDGSPSSGTLLAGARAAGRPARATPGATPTTLRRRGRDSQPPAARESARTRLTVIAVGVVIGALILVALLAWVFGGGQSDPGTTSPQDSTTETSRKEPAVTPPPRQQTSKAPALPPVTELLPDRTAAALVVRPQAYWQYRSETGAKDGRLTAHLDFLAEHSRFDPRKLERGTLAFVGLQGHPVAIGEGSFLTPGWVAELDRYMQARPLPATSPTGYSFDNPRRYAVVLGTRAYAVSPEANVIAELAARARTKRPPEQASPDLLGALAADSGPSPPLVSFAAASHWPIPGDRTSLVEHGIRSAAGNVRLVGSDLEFELVLTGRDQAKLQEFLNQYLARVLVRRYPGLRSFHDAITKAQHTVRPTRDDFVELHVQGLMPVAAFQDALEKLLPVPNVK